MSHPLLKAAIPLFFVSILLSPPAQKILCSCRSLPNVLEAYEAADEVLIVRVVSVGMVDGASGAPSNSDGAHAIIGRVERVYKGSSKVNDQLVFKQTRLSCDWTFDKDSLNQEHLFYLKRPAQPDDRWVASLCTRSNTLEFARDDLLYLDNLERLRGKTRVSGVYWGIQPSLLAAGKRKIRIISGQKTYELNTDENGVYEIYDLPPGKYRIEPELPNGWGFYGFYPRSTTSVRTRDTQGEFALEPDKHANINIALIPVNSLEGIIIGPNGNPLPSVCVHLWTPEQTEGPGPVSCADKKGRFVFESVIPGDYLLVLNPTGKVTSVEPFARVFYPGTEQREKAVSIKITAGGKLRKLKIVVPATSYR